MEKYLRCKLNQINISQKYTGLGQGVDDTNDLLSSLRRFDGEYVGFFVFPAFSLLERISARTLVAVPRQPRFVHGLTLPASYSASPVQYGNFGHQKLNISRRCCYSLVVRQATDY